MNIDDLSKKIKEYLDTQKPEFSVAWSAEIMERAQTLGASYPAQHIRSIHKEMFLEMVGEGRSYLTYHFPNLEPWLVDDIMQDALTKWMLYFNPQKNLERQFFKICVSTANIDEFNKENPVIGHEEVVDDEGRALVNESGSVVKKNFRAKKVSLETFSSDTREPDEVDGEIFDATNLATFEAGDYFEFPMADYESNDPEALSRANRLVRLMEYDDLRNRSETKPLKAKKKKTGLRTEPKLTSSQILYRYYLLKNVVFEKETDRVPTISARLIPRKAFINSISGNGLKSGTSAAYFRYRHSILKNSSNLQFMELCIRVLRNGLKQFEKEIEQGHFEPRDRKEIPMLSAVAADEKGRLIDYCFKGQVETFNPQGKRRTFQKHCEFSLLEEIIANKKKSKLLDKGTLYVTLEPCNMRTYYCLNPLCDDKCEHQNVELKIPCAVRCLESGVSTVYIGSIDTNKSVERKGEEILESGCYKFNLRDGNFFSDKSDSKKNVRDVRSQRLLEQYFIEKGYQLISSDSSHRTYRINNGVKVAHFPHDLVEEICQLNGTFLKHYNESNYY